MTGPLVDGGFACLVANGCSHGGKYEYWWLSLSLPSSLGGPGLLTGTVGLGRHAGQAGAGKESADMGRKGDRFHKTECLLCVGWMDDSGEVPPSPFRQSVSKVQSSSDGSSFGHSATLASLAATSQLLHSPTLLQVYSTVHGSTYLR